MIKTKDTFKLDLMNKAVQKIIDESVKPMSIVAIKDKYNLQFPFKVKRVKDSKGSGKFLGITLISKIVQVDLTTRENRICTVTNNEDGEDYQSAELQDYILFEEN